jgi:hypothetical protein
MVNDRDERAPVLTFAAVAPVVRDSRVAQMVTAVWDRLDAAVRHSSVAGAISTVSLRMLATSSSTRVLLVSWMVAVGAAANLLMLVSVERYHFPRRTALVLPALVVIVALVACALRADIARALEDRTDR